MTGKPGVVGVGAGFAVLANLLIVSILVLFFALLLRDPDLFYRSVQEDEALEWATFWSFLIAAGVALVVARSWNRSTDGLPWFLVGLALFCFLVAMEEISWGQRVIGYRPPAYFLEHNEQLEVNLHNWVDARLRGALFRMIIGGYGLVLPFAAWLFAREGLVERLGLVPPPAALAPAFAVTLLGDLSGAFRFDREVYELMLGSGILFALLARVPRSGRMAGPAVVVVVAAAVLGLGLASAAWSRHQAQSDPESLMAARIELEALREDFATREKPTRCGLHQRLSTYSRLPGADFLATGAFARLVAGGLPRDRAEYFLDPWNSPYWVVENCVESGRRKAWVYSFGPNRRRDSSDWELGRDDIGAVLLDVPAGEAAEAR